MMCAVKRGDQGEGHRHVDVEPDLQHRADPHVPAHPVQRRRLALEQHRDLIERDRLLALALRQPPADDPERLRIAAAFHRPGQPAVEAAAERILAERAEHDLGILVGQRLGGDLDLLVDAVRPRRSSAPRSSRRDCR